MFPSADLAQVRLDPSQAEQVLINLAVNARDAMPRGGRLTIETANVDLDAQYARQHSYVQAGSYVMLGVTDTGIGMPEDVRAHLFEPFFTTKSAGFVEGLGLPTVYGVVRQLGGEISVESALGRGTTFTIALPQAMATTVAPVPPAITETHRPPTETILLVDDEADVRSVVRQVLHQRGYTVLSAASGAQAMQIVETHTGGRLDLLVTDVLMPGMSGPQLFEQLVTRYPGLKVLYISGYADEELGRNPGAGAAFLAKPFRLETLATRVRTVLDSA
jgi:CheY-like chemotaxis protein